jgi:hypothetical protein
MTYKTYKTYKIIRKREAKRGKEEKKGRVYGPTCLKNIEELMGWRGWCGSECRVQGIGV